MNIHNFRELIAWQKAMQLTKKVYFLIKAFPDSERYGLISQIQRAVVSIPSNIAEGAGRPTQKELVHFLSFSLGSAYELETELLLAGELGYIDAEQSEQINAEVIEVQKLVYSLMKKFNLSDSN
ncbi:MAG: four helix bundle protein [Paludibacteraceae bacterium]|nr:four helix bundle protein [Paludibacteraceae bacterium]